MPRSGWAYTDLGYFNELGGMTGSIQFRTDCNSLSGSTNFVYASSSNRVGIREDLTQPGFDIQRGSTALPLYHPNAALEVRGDMNVTGSIYAKNYYIQNVSYMDLTGSTKFGDSAGDTHKFIGKMGIGTSFETGPSSDRRDPQSLLHIEHTDTTTWPSTVSASDEEYGDFLLTLRNHTDTEHAFAGMAFDVTSEIDADSLGAAIVAVADNTTSTAHDANLAFATNDAGDDGLTERMRITHDGKVGIGTTTPSSFLELESSSGDLIFEMDNNATNSANFQIQNGAGNNRIDIITNALNSGNPASLVDTKITMKDQKVGVMNTNPSYTLDVMGNAHIETTDTQLRLSYDTSNYSTFAMSSAGDLTITPSGGDATIVATTSIDLKSPQIDIGEDDASDVTINLLGSTNDMAIVYDESTKKLSFDTTDLVIDAANGRVGIGLADPDAMLEIFGTSTQLKLSYNADDYATLTVADTGDLTIATVGNGSVDSDLTLDADGIIVLDADGASVTIKDGGTTTLNIASNGTTDVKFDAPGDIKFDAEGNDYIFDPQGTESFRFTANGATSATLDVVGDLVIDADGGDISFKDGGTAGLILDLDTTAGACYFQNGAGNTVIAVDDGDQRLYFYDKGGEHIASDGSHLTLTSGGRIDLTAATDVIIPSGIGLHFDGTTGAEKIESDGTNLTITSGAKVICAAAANSYVEPATDNNISLGSPSKRWSNLYTGDLHLKNDRGDWTIIEESEYLTITNNANGKRYKIMMEEIED